MLNNNTTPTVYLYDCPVAMITGCFVTDAVPPDRLKNAINAGIQSKSFKFYISNKQHVEMLEETLEVTIPKTMIFDRHTDSPLEFSEKSHPFKTGDIIISIYPVGDNMMCVGSYYFDLSSNWSFGALIAHQYLTQRQNHGETRSWSQWTRHFFRDIAHVCKGITDRIQETLNKTEKDQ